MNSNTKKSLLALILLAPITILGTVAQAADQTDDWKSMPATACESNNNGLEYGNNSVNGAWGWVRATKNTKAQCPMVRDHRNARPSKFRVSFFHLGNKTTNCKVHVRSREANVGTSFPLNITGNGYIQKTINLNTTHSFGHAHLTCDASANTYILSYALHEL